MCVCMKELLSIIENQILTNIMSEQEKQRAKFLDSLAC